MRPGRRTRLSEHRWQERRLRCFRGMPMVAFDSTQKLSFVYRPLPPVSCGIAWQERRCFRVMPMAAQRELLMVQQMQHALHAIHSFLMANVPTHFSLRHPILLCSILHSVASHSLPPHHILFPSFHHTPVPLSSLAVTAAWHELQAAMGRAAAGAVTAAWHELQAAMGRAASVAAVVHAHHHYLHSILEGCFLINSTNMGKAITGLIVSLSSKTLLLCALYHSRRSLQRPHSMPSPTPSATAFATMPSAFSSTPMRTHTASSSTPIYMPAASSSRGGGREENSKGGAREERSGRAAAEEAAINAEIQQLGDFFHADVSAILQVARNQAEKLPSSIRDLLQQLNYNRFYG
ncbi:unnamed protein product [Closterium sp. NIES-64]|nr:unnamed protein product [Closterium sp. NIES-64]